MMDLLNCRLLSFAVELDSLVQDTTIGAIHILLRYALGGGEGVS